MIPCVPPILKKMYFFWWVNRVAVFCSTWYQVFTYYFTQLLSKPMELIINFGLVYKPNTQIDFKT